MNHPPYRAPSPLRPGILMAGSREEEAARHEAARSALDVLPGALTRPVRVALYSRNVETRRVVESMVVAPSYALLETPADPGLVTHTVLASLAATADLVLHDLVYVAGAEMFSTALRYAMPHGRLALLVANPYELGHMHRAGRKWTDWLRDRVSGLPPIDAWETSPLSRDGLQALLLGAVAAQLVTPAAYAIIAQDPE